MKQVIEIINKLENTSGTNDKIQILKDNKDNELLKKVLYYTYADNLQYGFSEKKLRELLLGNITPCKTIWDNGFDMLDKLASSNINDSLRDLVFTFLSTKSEEEQELYIRILTKDLRCNISAKSINKAIPKLIPTWEIQQGMGISKVKLKKDEWIALSLKLNGCFEPSTPILMADKSYKKIKDIKAGDLVLSFDENNKELVSKKVLNIFNNGRKPLDEWNRIGVFNKFKSEKKTVVATKNHKFYTPNGWVESNKINNNELIYMYGYELSQEQKDFLLGIGLGDGNVIKDNENLPSVRFTYCKVNVNPYIQFFNNALDLMDIYKGSFTIHKSGYGSEIQHQTIKTIKDIPNFYYNNSNIIKVGYTFTDEILKNLTPLALAIYYIDDGCILPCKDNGNLKTNNIKPRTVLATHRHPLIYVENFSKLLKDRWNISNRVAKYKDSNQPEGYGYQIEINVEGTHNLFDLIAKYIPYELREIKVPPLWRNVERIDWASKKGEYKLITRNLEESSDRVICDSAKNIRKSIVAYDLEIEDTHTYFANNFAVHNCRSTRFKGEFKSRQNKVQEGLNHIQNELNQIEWLSDFVIDGEMVRNNKDNIPDNENFRLTTSIMNSKSADKSEIIYTIFDLIPTEEFIKGESSLGFKDRLANYLDRLKEDIIRLDLKSIKVAPTYYTGTDHSKIDELLTEIDGQGMEGLMCLLNKPYKCKRHNGILKCKVFDTADCKIIGYEEGDGRLKGTLGSFVIDYKGNNVNVGSGYSDIQREEFWNNKDSYIGRILEVKYKEESKDKNTGLVSLQFPTFVCIREEGKTVSYN